MSETILLFEGFCLFVCASVEEKMCLPTLFLYFEGQMESLPIAYTSNQMLRTTYKVTEDL